MNPVHTSSAIKKRVFIVGTARSGTTLVQSMLASHTSVFSPPETHFFRRTIPKRLWMRPSKWYGKSEIETIRRLLKKIGYNDLSALLPRFTFDTSKWVESLINIIDQMCIRENKNIWLEKTPLHLYYIDLITSVEPETVFVHVLRRGEDVIASLYDVSRKYPEYFSGPQSINRCIYLWKKNLRISSKYIGKNNHVHVLYEKLVSRPEEILRKTCKVIGLDFSTDMLNYTHKAQAVQLTEEKWKLSNIKPLQKSSKFKKVFTKKQQAYIRHILRNDSLSRFNN